MRKTHKFHVVQNDTTLMYIALIGTIRWSNNILMVAILNFRELFGPKCMTL